MGTIRYLLILFISIYTVLSLVENPNDYQNEIDLDAFNTEIEESKCQKVIDTLKYTVKEVFIYNDIIKNPPNKDYYGSVDLEEEFSNINTQGRKYYDFFRDIKRITAKLKDGHVNFVATKCLDNGVCIEKLRMCLPISLVIKGNSSESAEVYIQKNENCLDYYDNSTIEFINNNLNNSLKSINNSNVFDFIQNFGVQFDNIKSAHGRFSYYLENIHNFQITAFPFTRSECSNITFIFNDNQNITLDYHLINTAHNLKQSEQNNDFKVENENKIQWKYSTKDPSIFQCLVDEENKVNVFKQEFFQIVDDLEEVVNNCTDEFYNNSYPIIGIESRNPGGNVIASIIVRQLIQVKILQRVHESVRYSEFIKNNLDIMGVTLYDVKTCEKLKDFEEIIDHYEGGIEHHRTQLTQRVNSSLLKRLKERRKKYYEYNHLKKPTEILIFTDFYSYSTTSFFIKGLQETGGAIIVGYKGNPKSNETLDASLSPSGALISLSKTEIGKNLSECDFQMNCITFRESFNYSYQALNPIPREYQINPVDERVNIYQRYDDSLYDDFIAEAKRIFKQYNEDKLCNPDNSLLTYEPDDNECYTFPDIPHAHGGYECDKVKKTWSQKCIPYYCDIGYYFDNYQNKCVKDICTEGKDDDDNNNSKFINGIIGLIILLIIL